MKDMYTYVLYDKVEKLYKIGKTGNPISRFSTLCTKGVVYPIALFPSDIEGKLHEMFKENRVTHPDASVGGATEYFRLGGKFTGFVERIEKESKDVPYCRVQDMVVDMMAAGNVELTDPLLLWNIDSDKFARYRIGLNILAGSGKIGTDWSGTKVIDDVNVMHIKGKLSITERLYDMLIAKVRVTLYFEEPLAKDLPKKFSRRVFDVDGEDVIMILTRL